MPTVTLYPTINNIYYTVQSTFSDARLASSGDDVITFPVSTQEDAYLSDINWKIYRTYLQFDLSSISGTITELQFGAASYIVQDVMSIAFGGLSPLAEDNTDYSLYLNNLQYIGGDPIPFYDNDFNPPLNDYSSVSLNIVNYPIDPPYNTLVIGLINKYDFTNSQPGLPEETSFSSNLYASSSLTYPPFLTVTYNAGYPNIVMGVPPANISTVMGVPTANIFKVMGV